jgi:hypothetical protein
MTIQVKNNSFACYLYPALLLQSANSGADIADMILFYKNFLLT